MLHTLFFLFLIAHGIGHVLGFLEAWTAVPAGFSDQPWLFSQGVTIESAVGKVFGLLWLVATAAFVAAGVGLATHQAWWRGLALAASVISLVAILPWWNTVTPGVRFAATLADVAIIVALSVPLHDAITEALR